MTPVSVNALEELTELDCSNCAIRVVDLLAGGGGGAAGGGGANTFGYASATGGLALGLSGSVPLTNLRAINLEHNLLTSLSGLLLLPHVRVLCLNYNRIECLVPNARGVGVGGTAGPALETGAPRGPLATAPLAMPLLERLEVLYLGNNGIKDLGALQLYRLPNLKSLFLHGTPTEHQHLLEFRILYASKFIAAAQYTPYESALYAIQKCSAHCY